MNADVAVFARAAWRAQWRSHVVVFAFVAISVAVCAASVVGAERSLSAYDRLRAASGATDIVLPGDEGDGEPLAEFADSPLVDRRGVFALMFVRPEGTDFIPDYNLLPIASSREAFDARLNQPVIISGRNVEPDRADEVVVSEDTAQLLDVTVGETLQLESMSDAWVDVAFTGGDPGPADGPRVAVTVVGVGRSPAHFGRWVAVMHLSPAFYEEHEGEMRRYVMTHATVTDATRRAMARGEDPLRLQAVEVMHSFFGANDAAGEGLNAIAVALRLVGGVGVVAGVLASGLLLARVLRVALLEQATMVALGWTRRRLRNTAMLVGAPAVGSGVLVGVAAGVAVSPLVLFGLTEQIDPEPRAIVVSTSAFLAAVVVAALLAAAVVAVVAAIVVVAPSDRAADRREFGPLRRPVAPALGVRWALAGARSGAGRASRGATVAAVVGGAAAVAALVVAASIEGLQSDPSLFGHPPGLVIDSGESLEVYERALPMLEADERVAMLVGVHVSFDITPNEAEAATLVYDIRRGDDSGPSILAGRLAKQPDEVALGPTTLDDLGVAIGDSLQLFGPDDAAAEYTIVGSVLFPEGDFNHNEGFAMNVGGADRLLGDAVAASQIHQVAFSWADGVDAAAATRELEDEGLNVQSNEGALRPAVVTNLGEVTPAARFLAPFFGLLVAVTLGHALVVGLRLRRREHGVLRVLGMRRWSSAAIVVVQSVTIMLVGAVVGVPIGVVLGSQVWNVIGSSAQIVVRTEVPWATISAIAGLAASGAVAVALVPAARMLALRVGECLRTE